MWGSVLLALVAAVAVWGLPVFLISTAMGWEVGHRLAARVPPGQDHLPVRLVRVAPLLVGLWVGAMNGLQSAVPEGLIAMGDTWAAAVPDGAAPRIAWPWRPPPAEAPPDLPLVASTRQRIHEASVGQLVLFASVKVIVGGLLQPLQAAVALQQAAVEEGAWSAADARAAWRRAWWRARPRLVVQAHVGVAASAVLTGVYLLGLAVFGRIVVKMARADLARPTPAAPSGGGAATLAPETDPPRAPTLE